MRYLLPLLFLAVPAAAQQPTPYTPTVQLLAIQAATCEQIATNQVQQLSKQIADLTKERDELKAAAK